MRVYLYIVIILLINSCNDKKVNNGNVIIRQNKTTDSIHQRINDSVKMASLDTIFRKEKDFYLKIHKLPNSFLQLDYKLKNEKKEHSFKLRYFDETDNIFPINGVGHLDSKNIKLEKYYIYKDSILILPILSIPNQLSLYFIDLKKEENLVYYFKTSLLFFWIRTKNGLEIISAKRPEIDYDYNYNTYKYTLIKWRLKSDYLEDVKVDSIVLKYNINDSLKKQYEIIKRF